MPLQYLGNPPLASDRQARPFSPAARRRIWCFWRSWLSIWSTVFTRSARCLPSD